MKQERLLGVILLVYFCLSTTCDVIKPVDDVGNKQSHLRLRFRKRRFKIVQFTDLHFGESFEKDQETIRVMNSVLKEETPDFVALTGDVTSAYAWDGTPDWTFRHWFNATSPMRDHKVPYASIFGNHDDGGVSKADLMGYDQSLPYSLSLEGPKAVDGIGNYVLHVYEEPTDSDDELDENAEVYAKASDLDPIAHLVFFDSHRYNVYSGKEYGGVYPSQVSWFSLMDLQNPTLAFVHMPIHEYMTMFAQGEANGMLLDTGVCCGSVNPGLFAAFQENRQVKGVFCGHDHMNDFCGMYEDVLLAYGRKTGVGGYGNLPVGARVIELSLSGAPVTMKLSTWIREGTGKTVHSWEQYRGGWSGWHRRQFVQCCVSVHDGLVLWVWVVAIVMMVGIGVGVGLRVLRKRRLYNHPHIS